MTDQKTTIYLSTDQHRAMRRAAFDQDMSMAELVRVAVGEWLERMYINHDISTETTTERAEQ